MRAWLAGMADRIIGAADELTELDARIGDGDHGINLARGMLRLRNLAVGEGDAPPAELLRSAGRLLVSSVGGASGPLYGTFLLEAGDGMEPAAEPAAALGAAFARGVAGVARRGRSTVGQKTMLDTLVPAAAALGDAGSSAARPIDAERVVAAARAGCESTRPMVAQRGRASYLGERAIGHLDPGAVSSLLVVEALAAALAAQPPAPTSTRLSR